MTAEANIFNELETLLTEQLDLARRGELKRIHQLAERTAELVAQLEQSAARADEKLAPQLERIALLYKELSLTLASHKQELADQLEQLLKGKNTLKAYRPHGGR